jgi:hypothetical protein
VNAVKNNDRLDRYFRDAEDLQIDLLKKREGYRLEADIIYEGSEAAISLSIDSEEELAGFYEEFLSQRPVESMNGVYGNSELVRQSVAERDTWGLAREEAWATDVLQGLDRNIDTSSATYEDVVDCISTTALAVISRSQGFDQPPTESYEFYQDLVEDLDRREKPRGIRGRIKQRAKDRAKKEAVDAAQEMRKEAEKEYRRMKREGEIEELKQQAKKRAKEAAVNAATNTWQNSKQRLRDRTRKEFEDVKTGIESLGENIRQGPLTRRQQEDEDLPEPELKIERGDITIYDYREDALEK